MNDLLGWCLFNTGPDACLRTRTRHILYLKNYQELEIVTQRDQISRYLLLYTDITNRCVSKYNFAKKNVRSIANKTLCCLLSFTAILSSIVFVDILTMTICNTLYLFLSYLSLFTFYTRQFLDQSLCPPTLVQSDRAKQSQFGFRVSTLDVGNFQLNIEQKNRCLYCLYNC